jgi:hypothetical protein
MAHGLVLGWPVYGSTVDSIVAGGRGSSELGLTAAPVHCGSPVMEQWRKERVGSPSQASPGLGRWCGDWATATKKRWSWRLVRAVLGRRKKRKRAGGSAVEDDGALPFYRGKGGRRPGMAGDSGKWVPSWLPLLGVKGVVTMVDGRGGGGYWGQSLGLHGSVRGGGGARLA